MQRNVESVCGTYTRTLFIIIIIINAQCLIHISHFASYPFHFGVASVWGVGKWDVYTYNNLYLHRTSGHCSITKSGQISSGFPSSFFSPFVGGFDKLHSSWYLTNKLNCGHFVVKTFFVQCLPNHKSIWSRPYDES